VEQLQANAAVVSVVVVVVTRSFMEAGDVELMSVVALHLLAEYGQQEQPAQYQFKQATTHPPTVV